MELETIEIVHIDDTGAPRCSDYDDECVDVVDPFLCWSGNCKLDVADGYCPLMYKSASS